MGRIIALLCAATLALSACGGESADVGQFQDDLDAQAAAQQALRDRIEELETMIQAATPNADTDGALTSLEETLTGLQTQLTDLAAKIDGEVTSREDGDAEQLAALAALESILETVQTTIDTLRDQVQELRDDHELLKAQFDRHDHG